MSSKEKRPSDRRRTPRVRAEHEVVLRSEGAADFKARSVDLNLGGIYCTLDRHVPLFTKVGMALSLPIQFPDELLWCDLDLEGVVVRMEPEDPTPGVDEYACAMAFVHISEDAELVVAKYILQALVKEGA